MRIARHGTGPGATLRALGSQIHPVFMLPPVAASLFGAVLAGEFAPIAGALHASATFLGVYTAHVKDGYVDFHVRGEDDDHPLTEDGCRLALAAATLGFVGCTLALWFAVGAAAALVTAPGWLIGYLHAPQLDTNPVTTTLGYPTGIGLALIGGAYVQTGRLVPIAVAFGLVFQVVLAGIKVIDDSKDYAYDRSIDKRTVAVALGPARARDVAYVLMVAGILAVVLLAAWGMFPRSAIIAAGAFGLVAGIAARSTDPELATMLLIRGSYVFLALLVAAVWYEPFGGA